MNKNDLIAAVAASSGLTKADAGKATDAVFDAITDALKSGGEVRLPGFGSFSVGAARQGRNPQTGATIQIAASKAPKFKAGISAQGCCELRGRMPRMLACASKWEKWVNKQHLYDGLIHQILLPDSYEGKTVPVAMGFG